MDPSEFARKFFEVVDILNLDVGEIYRLVEGDLAEFFEDFESQEGRPADQETRNAVIAVIKEGRRIQEENDRAEAFGRERGAEARTWGGMEPTEKDNEAFAALLGRPPRAEESDIFFEAFLEATQSEKWEDEEEGPSLT